MKSILSICIALFAWPLLSQTAETPVIVTKIKSGESLSLNGYSIQLVEVTEDSRCPSDVTCVWAGQAKVKVLISHHGNTEEKEIVFKGNNIGNEKEHTLLTTDKKAIVARQLHPYPISTDYGKREYVLEVFEKIITQP